MVDVQATGTLFLEQNKINNHEFDLQSLSHPAYKVQIVNLLNERGDYNSFYNFKMSALMYGAGNAYPSGAPDFTLDF